MDSPHKPRICISVCEATVAALQNSLAAAAEVGDLIEVRLDCLEPAELETGASLITTLLEKLPRETILTFRPAEQGGQRRINRETRRAFWSGAIFSESFFDVELDVAEEFNSIERPHRYRLIGAGQSVHTMISAAFPEIWMRFTSAWQAPRRGF